MGIWHAPPPLFLLVITRHIIPRTPPHIFDQQSDVEALSPDFGAMEANVLATAIAAGGVEGTDDFVSRFFGPCIGIPEDPVTGSAHCTLAPFWHQRLGGRQTMRARQLSSRGGELLLEMKGDRVLISGACAFFMEGTYSLPEEVNQD